MELLHHPGEIIAERYRIIDTLGQGGSGTTYQAQDLQSDQRVALKALSLHRMSEWKMMELFEREARILKQLAYPAIPRYLDYFCVDTPQDRCFYIAQQLAPGKSLAAWVTSGWRTDEGEVRRIAIQILEILIYLHSLTPPVIHRDIKPQNIIRRDDGQVFLVDFGAVQNTYQNTFMRGSTVVGTYGYMAPEQFRGQAVPATDLYGLGATLLFVLTHRSPAELPNDRLKTDFRSHIQISAEFADWLEMMLEPDLEDRFPLAKAALGVLRGQRLLTFELGFAVPWKALVGVGVAAIAAVAVLTFFEYPILKSLGFSPLTISIHQAAQKGDMYAVWYYLAQGDDVNAKDNEGLTPLYWAVIEGNKDVASLLIAKGADVNAKDNTRMTPLHEAAKVGYKDLAELLIAKGANVNAKESEGITPLQLAVKSNKKDIAELLIAKEADVNAKDNQGNTPLEWALENNWKDVAEQMIAKGADVNARNEYGITPLAQTVGHDKTDLAKWLIDRGADVNTKDSQGHTLLHMAVIGGWKDMVKLLLDRGADVNTKDELGLTPLHWAFGRDIGKDYERAGDGTLGMIVDHSDNYIQGNAGSYFNQAEGSGRIKNMIELLIAKGADVNAKDNEGTTPLHTAITLDSKDSKEIAELLLAKGADINAKDNDGYTPLHRAAAMGYTGKEEMVELLKLHGGKN